LSLRSDWQILGLFAEARVLTRNRYSLIGRMLALALLVAQFGAEIHVYSHSLTDPVERLGAARSCGYCLASSQLQIAVGAPASALPLRSLAWATLVPEPVVSATYQSPFRAFRSRAPPVLA
jgi:hypothetical protein